jgi:hypothetical protein
MLREARAALVRTLAAPERELPEVVATAPTAAETTQVPDVVRRQPPLPEPGGGAASPERGVAPRVATAPVPAPQRPGFVVKGSVEVALLWGVVLLLGGCVVFGIAGLAEGVAPLALVVAAAAVATIGSIVTAFALLVALVRRDRERS